MGSSKPATTTTTQSRSPWAPAQGNLTYGLEQSLKLAKDTNRWTPTYSSSTNAGISGLEAAAADGSAAYDTMNQVIPKSTAGYGVGTDQQMAAARGDYLNGNPYLDKALQSGGEAITNGVNGVFAGAGRYGNAAHTGALTKGLGEMETSARMAAYDRERTAQDQAARGLMAGGFQGAAMSPALDQAQINPALLQLQAGALRDQQSMATKQAPIQATQWLNSQSLPIANAGGESTGTQQTVQPTNKFGQILGGAQMGLGLLAAPFTGGASLGMVASGANGLINGGGTVAPGTAYSSALPWAPQNTPGYGSLGAF